MFASMLQSMMPPGVSMEQITNVLAAKAAEIGETRKIVERLVFQNDLQAKQLGAIINILEPQTRKIAGYLVDDVFVNADQYLALGGVNGVTVYF